jgi:hypothetical protein
MGLLACKYFDNVGFVGLRIKERTKEPTVYIRSSAFGGMERLYLWDNVIKYSEGMNEHGVSVMSNNYASDLSKEQIQTFVSKSIVQKKERQRTDKTNNIQIRKALLAETVNDAIEALIESEATGISVVFDSMNCALFKAMAIDNLYYYFIVQIERDEMVYQALSLSNEKDHQDFFRQMKITRDYDDFFKYLVPEMRTENTNYESILVPSKKEIQYRAVNCNTVFTSSSRQEKLTLSILKKKATELFQFSELYK